MLDALDITQVSLHSADPGTAGTANELSGGTPAYARQNITHAAAANGNRDSTAVIPFDIPPGGAVAYVGYWAGANFRGSQQLAQTENFAGQGVYNLADSDLNLNDA